MKYSKMIKGLLWGLLLACNPYTQAFAQDLDIEFITESWAPYNYSENGVIKGFSVEIVQAMMAELEESHKITLYPGARGEAMLKTKDNIFSFSLFRTPERESQYKWIGPISKEALYFYKRQNDPRIFNSLEDIKKVKKISAPHKGLVLTALEDLGLSNIHKMHSLDAQFQHGIMGRSDLVVNVPTLGLTYYLKKLNEPSHALVKTQVKLLEFSLYIACSKKVPDSIIEKWQTALDKVKASGQYTKIYNKYL